ncbi:MAG TPA: peptide chain release factor N(5)-glutamine methyltransferase [Acidimicrobiales bacterium]|nr:peptide chain release factor N(5)-glutamine methyltransferase [Acidimicrobiales bacterium]
MNWRELYEQALTSLADRQAARWLVEEVSGDRWPLALGCGAPDRAASTFHALLARRLAGEPVQYVLGHWAFRQLDLLVDGRVLIPRPETEVVVEVALRELDQLGAVKPVVVDLGTGSGAIALSVAFERANAAVWAGDASADALEVASANLVGLGAQCAGRVHLVHGSWWDALPTSLKGSVDLAVSNPPYISSPELPRLPAEVAQWEPLEALIAGPTGLEAYEAVVPSAREWLSPHAVLVCEIAPQQAAQVEALARASGFKEVSVVQDMSGRDRALVARR